jgi:hypothetical protein
VDFDASVPCRALGFVMLLLSALSTIRIGVTQPVK